MGSNPRDPERIGPILEKIKEAWQIYPDMRLGQLLVVCAKSANLAGIEDDELMIGVQRYIDSMKSATESLQRR